MSAASLSQKNRITGGLVDRDQPLGFRFDGQHYTGFAGDTLASALLANWQVMPMPTYHRQSRYNAAHQNESQAAGRDQQARQ